MDTLDKIGKKLGQDVNLKNTDHAIERYNELVNLVLYGRSYLNLYTEEEYIEDTISLDGNDWTFSQHMKVDIEPKECDYENTVKEYLSWKIAELIKEGDKNDSI